MAHGGHGGGWQWARGGPERRGLAVDLAGAEVEEDATAALGRLPVTISGGERRRLRPRTFLTQRHGLRCPVATTATARAPAAVRASLGEEEKGARGGKRRGSVCAQMRERTGGVVLIVAASSSHRRQGVGRAT